MRDSTDVEDRRELTVGRAVDDCMHLEESKSELGPNGEGRHTGGRGDHVATIHNVLGAASAVLCSHP